MDAGKAIMNIYSTSFDIEFKDDQSPLTKADISSHEIISKYLKKLTPRIPILSEESSKKPLSQRKEWGEYWLVDPLDGTKEFIKRNGEFTTNIALMKDNKPIFGVIHVPAKNHSYWGSEKTGSFMISNGSERRKLNVSNNYTNLKIASSRSHPSVKLSSLLEKIKSYQLISVGSSLKFCLVATGEADCYPRLGPTCEWDIAAGEIIAKGAGAKVIDLNNESIKYNKSENYINPYFLVTNSDETAKRLLSML